MALRLPRLVVYCCAACACTGPSLHIDNPGAHPVYLDGKADARHEVPFRYYGTTRWDAEPADVLERPTGPLVPDWRHLPTSRSIELPPPASPWIFPLDFPLELLARLANGRADVHTTVEVQPAPLDTREEAEVLLTEMPALRQRAQEARIAR